MQPNSARSTTQKSQWRFSDAYGFLVERPNDRFTLETAFAEVVDEIRVGRQQSIAPAHLRRLGDSNQSEAVVRQR